MQDLMRNLLLGGGGGFSPQSLFTGGVVGAFYDSSDLSTLYQDSAGTTPVTGVEQVVGLMLDKSQGLVLGPELVTNGTFDANITGWSVLSTATQTWTSNGIEVSRGGASFVSQSAGQISLVAGKTYVVTCDVTVAPTAGNGSIGVFGADRLTERTLPGSASRNTVGELRTVFTATTTETGFVVAGISGSTTGTVTFDNISVRELPGNHATSTGSARPTLSARVNLLTYSEQFDNAAWSKLAATAVANAIVAPDGVLSADRLQESTATNYHGVSGAFTLVAGTTYSISVYAKASERTCFTIGAGSLSYGFFDLLSGVATPGAGNVNNTVLSASMSSVGNGWYRCVVVVTRLNTNLSGAPEIYLSNTSTPSTTVATSYTGDGTSGIYIWGADLRLANIGVNIPSYQRIAAATDYDTNGFPFYLSFGGAQSMSTPANLDLTGTDEVTVYAGVRKLSDAARAMVTELSATYLNTGTFAIGAPHNGAASTYEFAANGTPSSGGGVYYPSGYVAPVSNVLAMSVNFAGANLAQQIIPRINGTVTQTAGAGTASGGAFGTYPLYIGARNNSSLFFNGYLYALIIQGTTASATQLASTEAWVNQKTKAY